MIRVFWWCIYKKLQFLFWLNCLEETIELLSDKHVYLEQVERCKFIR